MKKITLFAIASILILSCTHEFSEPLNAITDLKEFTHAAAKSKFEKVESIEKESLYGEWTVIASFFTIKDSRSVTTFRIEGRKYTINKDGNLITDTSMFGGDKRTEKWKLKSDNTVFDDGFESWHIKVRGDTMEWMQQMDEDYSYFVLVKE
jgi:hypothetical protein